MSLSYGIFVLKIAGNEDALLDGLYGEDLTLLEKGVEKLFSSISYDNYSNNFISEL